jgi:hypothetical protein
LEKTMRTLIPILLCASLLAGCQFGGYRQGEVVGQGLIASYEESGQGPTVVVERADGTISTGSATASPALLPGDSKSPVVKVTTIPGTPTVKTSYRVTPQTDGGFRVYANRNGTWAGSSPGEVLTAIATQKEKITNNPLPAVTLDRTGVHATAGGGSIDEVAGLSWSTRLWNWARNLVRGWSMWLLVAGIGIAAIFILPLFIPALVPVMAALWGAIRTVVGWVWDVIERIITWFESKMQKKAAVPSAPPPSTIPPPKVN